MRPIEQHRTSYSQRDFCEADEVLNVPFKHFWIYFILLPPTCIEIGKLGIDHSISWRGLRVFDQKKALTINSSLDPERRILTSNTSLRSEGGTDQ